MAGNSSSESQTKGSVVSLNGVKVVDLTRNATGPTCTMILVDRGAEAIKLEELAP